MSILTLDQHKRLMSAALESINLVPFDADRALELMVEVADMLEGREAVTDDELEAAIAAALPRVTRCFEKYH